MTKHTRINWDASKKVWILPDGSALPSFDWERFHRFGDHLEFRTINQPKEKVSSLTATQYYEKYYGRRARPNGHDKVDKVLDTLVGVERKTPVKSIKHRVTIKKTSPSMI